jgi:hypothetical protein
MGGTMWVESEGLPGRGSVFHLTVAAVPADLPAPAQDGGAAHIDLGAVTASLTSN